MGPNAPPAASYPRAQLMRQAEGAKRCRAFANSILTCAVLLIPWPPTTGRCRAPEMHLVQTEICYDCKIRIKYQKLNLKKCKISLIIFKLKCSYFGHVRLSIVLKLISLCPLFFNMMRTFKTAYMAHVCGLQYYFSWTVPV